MSVAQGRVLHVARCHVLKPFISVFTVHREGGPRWFRVPEGRLQPGPEPGGGQVHPAHERWRDQTDRTVHRHARVSDIGLFRVSHSFCLLPGAEPGVPGAVERLPLLCR